MGSVASFHRLQAGIRVLLLVACLSAPAAASGMQAQATSPAPAAAAIHAYDAGLDARARGDERTASLFFEQALMLEPEFAGAWFDYGLSLCQLGDPQGCRNILAQAVEQFGMPPALTQRVWQTLRSHRGELRVGLGASTNLLRATSVRDFTLLLNGERVPALLDRRFREQGGGYAETALSFESRWPLSDVSARVELLGRRPFNTRLPGFVSGYGELGVGIVPRTRAGVLALSVDEGYLGSIVSMGAWVEHRLSPEGAAVRATLEHRKPQGQASWVTTRLLARIPLGDDTALTTGWEYDFKQRDRAGQAQHRLVANLRSDFTLPPLGSYLPRLTLGAGAMHSRDAEAYSPLFGDTHNRRTRLHAFAELAVNLDRNWRLALVLNAAQQRASIELFDYREVSAQFNVGYHF